jgi:hypothetical protein
LLTLSIGWLASRGEGPLGPGDFFKIQALFSIILKLALPVL